MKKITMAYAAGIFDGEGWISLSKRGKGQYSLRTHIANTNKEVIEFIKHKFGGSFCTRNNKRSFGKKTQYLWQPSDKISESFLRAVLPYLIIKKRKAEIALQMRKTFSSDRGNRWQGVNPETVAKRQKIYELFKAVS